MYYTCITGAHRCICGHEGTAVCVGCIKCVYRVPYDATVYTLYMIPSNLVVLVLVSKHIAVWNTYHGGSHEVKSSHERDTETCDLRRLRHRHQTRATDGEMTNCGYPNVTHIFHNKGWDTGEHPTSRQYTHEVIRMLKRNGAQRIPW